MHARAPDLRAASGRPPDLRRSIVAPGQHRRTALPPPDGRTVPASDRLFVFAAPAVSVDAVPYRPGQRRAHVIVTRAHDLARGRSLAVDRVEAEGWTAPTPLRSQELPVGAAPTADDTLRPAAAPAVRDGCGFVAYPDPPPHDA